MLALVVPPPPRDGRIRNHSSAASTTTATVPTMIRVGDRPSSSSSYSYMLMASRDRRALANTRNRKIEAGRGWLREGTEGGEWVGTSGGDVVVGRQASARAAESVPVAVGEQQRHVIVGARGDENHVRDRRRRGDLAGDGRSPMTRSAACRGRARWQRGGRPFPELSRHPGGSCRSSRSFPVGPLVSWFLPVSSGPPVDFSVARSIGQFSPILKTKSGGFSEKADSLAFDTARATG